MKVTETRLSRSGRTIKKPRYADSEPSDIDDDEFSEESKSLSSVEEEVVKEVLTESEPNDSPDEDDFDQNEHTLMPNSDNSVDDNDD